MSLASEAATTLRALALCPPACLPGSPAALRHAAAEALATLASSYYVSGERGESFQRACAQMAMVRHSATPAECEAWAAGWEAVGKPDTSSAWYFAGVEDALVTEVSESDDMSGAHLGENKQAVTDWRAGVDFVRGLKPCARRALATVEGFDRMVPAARAALFVALSVVTDETTLRVAMATLGDRT